MRKRDRKERFRAILDELTEYVVRWKPGGIRTFVNAAYSRAFDASEEELIGTSFYPLISEEDRARVEERIARLSPEAPVSTAEHKVRLPNGSEGWQLWTDRALFDSRGTLIEYQSVGRDITEIKQRESELRASRERLSRLTIELQKAEERERQRIANYLHDEVGQALAVLRMKLAALGPADRAETVRLRGEMSDLLDRTIEVVRSFTLDLSPPALYELGLAPAVEWMSRGVADEHRLELAFEDDGTDKPLSEPSAALLYRGARELLMNVVKHSGAVSVRVTLGRTADDRIEVVVEDDGRGLGSGAAATSNGFGLFSLRERLHALGGQLRLETSPAGGTRAVMLVPLRPS